MMARLNAIVLSIWLAFAPSFAQVGQIPGWPPIQHVSSGGYTGPGDITTSWVMWAGLRCYSAAYAGNAFDLTDTATGNTTGSRVQCSGGTLTALVSGSACTFVTGNACSSIATTCATSCNIATMYDQTGNANCAAAACTLTQATNANRPIYLTSGCPNSLTSCARFIVSTMELDSPTLTHALPMTLVSTANRSQNPTTQSGIMDCNNGGVVLQFATSANTIQGYAGNVITQGSNTDGNWFAIQFVAAAASSSLNINGTQTTGASESNTCTTAVHMGRSGGGDPPNGYINEIGIGSISFTTQLSTLNTNMRAAYGGF